MKQWFRFFSVMALAALLGPASQAAQTYGQFTDPFGAAGLDPNWVAIDASNPVQPAVVDESLTVPSNDGKVLELDGSQAVLAKGTEDWTNATISVSILPLNADLSIQGILAGACNGFAFNDSDAYIAATFLRAGGQSLIRLWVNGGGANSGFPGNTAATVVCPGNPLDGQYHTLTLKVNRDNNALTITALWDGTEVTHFGPDPSWDIRIPMGRVGVFSWFRSPGDKTRFDNFQATWDNAPPAPTPLGTQFTDKFGATIDSHWTNATPTEPFTMNDETATIPSNDGKVLALDGSNALTVRGTENWKNVTVSAWIMPLDANLSIQGVLAGASSGLTCTTGDSYFAATYLRDSGVSYIRLWDNGLGAYSAFPGNVAGNTVACPGNPLDGQYHQLSLTVNRDGTHPLLTASWDGVAVVTFGPDDFWNNAVPMGRVGVFSWFRAPGDLTLFDNFQATTTDTVPVELSSFSVN